MSEVTAEIIEGDGPDDLYVQWGGIDPAPSWDEYLESWVEEFRPVILAMRKAVEESPWMRATADAFCNGHYFALSEPVMGVTNFAFTWRAWGDFMQAIVDKREGYLAYYM